MCNDVVGFVFLVVSSIRGLSSPIFIEVVAISLF